MRAKFLRMGIAASVLMTGAGIASAENAANMFLDNPYRLSPPESVVIVTPATEPVPAGSVILVEPRRDVLLLEDQSFRRNDIVP